MQGSSHDQKQLRGTNQNPVMSCSILRFLHEGPCIFHFYKKGPWSDGVTHDY